MQGFYTLVAAMVLQPVEKLSDEEPGTGSSGSKPDPKPVKLKPKEKAPAKPKAKQAAKKNAPKPTKKAKAKAFPEKESVGETEEPVAHDSATPKKRPAASGASNEKRDSKPVLKKPAAQVAEFKVQKGYYARDRKYGFKWNGHEQYYVTFLQPAQLSLNQCRHYNGSSAFRKMISFEISMERILLSLCNPTSCLHTAELKCPEGIPKEKMDDIAAPKWQ